MANPWKLLTSLIVRGCGHSVIAFTFPGSAETPLDEIINPKKITLSIQKALFWICIKLLSLECAEDLPQMDHMFLLSLVVDQYIIKIDHYEFTDKRSKQLSITLMKVLGVLDSPKGITNYSYNPSLILNAVFHSFPDWILIWWYPLLRSILEKIVALDIRSSISSRRGMGKRYLTVILLMARL